MAWSTSKSPDSTFPDQTHSRPPVSEYRSRTAPTFRSGAVVDRPVYQSGSNLPPHLCYDFYGTAADPVIIPVINKLLEPSQLPVVLREFRQTVPKGNRFFISGMFPPRKQRASSIPSISAQPNPREHERSRICPRIRCSSRPVLCRRALLKGLVYKSLFFCLY